MCSDFSLQGYNGKKAKKNNPLEQFKIHKVPHLSENMKIERSRKNMSLQYVKEIFEGLK